MREVFFRGALGIYSKVCQATGNSSRAVVCFFSFGIFLLRLAVCRWSNLGFFFVLGLFVKRRVLGCDLLFSPFVICTIDLQ